MNKAINEFLLTGDKFMPEMHLRQPGLMCITFEPFAINKWWIQKFIEAGDSRNVYQNELDKTWFQYGFWRF